MQKPETISGLPYGLEFLTQLDQIQAQQIPRLPENFNDKDTWKKYVIKNSNGQKVYYAIEEGRNLKVLNKY